MPETSFLLGCDAVLLGIKKFLFRVGHFQTLKLKKEAAGASEMPLSSSDYTASHSKWE
jgi:hypothetical protein